MTDKHPIDYNLQYFTATILKDGKITIPVEKRQLFHIRDGELWLFQAVRRLTTIPEVTTDE